MVNQKIRNNPGKLFGVWLLTMLVLTSIFAILSEIGASGGEQRFFSTLSFMLLLTVVGIAVIAVLIPFIYKQWFKSNIQALILLIVIIVIPALGFVWMRYFEDPYSYIESTRYVGGDIIEIKKEFYDDANQLRSVSYIINGRKDSIWTTYDRQGKVIEQKKY